jgi:hypothetical protein
LSQHLHACKDHVHRPLTNPASLLHGFVFPCDGFQGWKGIAVRGKKASRSFGDLHGLNDYGWKTLSATKRRATVAGRSRLEVLPAEVLAQIIEYLVCDAPPDYRSPRNADLAALLLTSRTIHSATLASLYKTITIPHSKIFRKFLCHISEHPALGTIVRRLDFSHFNNTVAGMTASERASTMNLTQDTLLQCLELLPNLREFLAQEHIEDEMSQDVLLRLFNMPRLRAVDFCASGSSSFYGAMSSIFELSSPRIPDTLASLMRVSFHRCNISEGVLGRLLPRLERLTHLDISGTNISNAALQSIPESARLTHLNLSRCRALLGPDTVGFLTTHPATRDTLVVLNLMADSLGPEMLTADDLAVLLPLLPPTLRSLNLKGSEMALPRHADALRPLTRQLEELSIGRMIGYRALADFLLQGLDPGGPVDVFRSTLKQGPADPLRPTLKYLDISDMHAAHVSLVALLSPEHSLLRPGGVCRGALDALDVLEVSPSLAEVLHARPPSIYPPGWVFEYEGWRSRRSWLVRRARDRPPDDGRRAWKMGATYWGMRKLPVSVQEVGGMYGRYMFKL